MKFRSILFAVVVSAFGCGDVTALSAEDAGDTGEGGTGAIVADGGAGATGKAGTTGEAGAGGASGAGVGGQAGTAADGGAGTTGTGTAGTMASAGTTGSAVTTGSAGRGGTGGAPMPYCTWIKYFDANGTGTVLDVVAQNNTNDCLTAATNYKRQHTRVPICQGQISGQASTFDSLDIVSAYPDASGLCQLTVNTIVPILVPGSTCNILVTTSVSTPYPVMMVRNPPPPCTN